MCHTIGTVDVEQSLEVTDCSVGSETTITKTDEVSIRASETAKISNKVIERNKLRNVREIGREKGEGKKKGGKKEVEENRERSKERNEKN